MSKVKVDRRTLVKTLRARDGDTCAYPGCGKEMDFKTKDTARSATIDHREPQGWCRANGWTEEEIWDLSNLDLQCKSCNADKGDRRYNPDGTLPPKPQSRKARRIQRGPRPDVCSTCYSGRILLIGETCPDCNSGPQPTYPTAYQRRSSECPHSGPYSCWACTLGIVEREPAIVTVLDGGILDA